MATRRRSKACLVAVVAIGAVIVAATAIPAVAPPSATRCPPFALWCGEFVTADWIANLALYAPLGVTLWIAGWGRVTGWAAAVALSAGIELLQLWLPGRDGSVRDV